MSTEYPVTDRNSKFFDFCGAVFARGAMDDVLDGFSRDKPVGAPLAKGGGEIPFEPERHRQFLGIMPIAAAHDPEHAEPRLTVAAGTDSGHGRNVP